MVVGVWKSQTLVNGAMRRLCLASIPGVNHLARISRVNVRVLRMSGNLAMRLETLFSLCQVRNKLLILARIRVNYFWFEGIGIFGYHASFLLVREMRLGAR